MIRLYGFPVSMNKLAERKSVAAIEASRAG